jgi:hypothetical protein
MRRDSFFEVNSLITSVLLYKAKNNIALCAFLCKSVQLYFSKPIADAILLPDLLETTNVATNEE